MANRIEDTQFMFGVRRQGEHPGAFLTEEQVTCAVCKKTHNEIPPYEHAADLLRDDLPPEDKYKLQQDYDSHCQYHYDQRVDVCYEHVFGLTVCEACFNKVERWIVSRMNDIAPWYRRALNEERKRLNTAFAALNGEANGGVRDMETH